MGTKKMKLALRVPEGLKLELQALSTLGQVTVDCLGASIVTKFLQRYALNPTETIAHLSFIPRKTHRTRVKLKLLLPEDLGSRLQLIALVEQGATRPAGHRGFPAVARDASGTHHGRRQPREAPRVVCVNLRVDNHQPCVFTSEPDRRSG